MPRATPALLILILALAPRAAPGQSCLDCDRDGYDWPLDCNDATGRIGPGQAEACDGFDDDCNGVPDDDPACRTECPEPEMLGDGRSLTPGTAREREPSLAWTGSGYGMAWSDGLDLKFADLDAAGRLLGTPRIITLGPSRPAHPALVWTGSEFGLVFDDARDGPRLGRQIFFMRLDRAGKRLGGDVQISASNCDTGFPALVWNGSGYGVAWEDCSGPAREWQIAFARLDPGGSRVGVQHAVTDTPGSSFSPSLVWNGAGFGVSWHDLRPLPGSGGNFEIFLALLDPDGSKTAPETRVTTAVGSGFETSLAWSGREYAVAWHDRRDDPGLLRAQVYLARLGPDGLKLADEVRLTGAGFTAELPSLNWTGTEFGLAWTQLDLASSPFFEVRFLRVHELGFPLGAPLRISQGQGDGWRPALAWNGAGFGVGWDDNRGGGREIYFAVLGCGPDGDEESCQELDGARAPGRLVSCLIRHCMEAARAGMKTPRECAGELRDQLPLALHSRPAARSERRRTGRR